MLVALYCRESTTTFYTYSSQQTEAKISYFYMTIFRNAFIKIRRPKQIQKSYSTVRGHKRKFHSLVYHQNTKQVRRNCYFFHTKFVLLIRIFSVLLVYSITEFIGSSSPHATTCDVSTMTSRYSNTVKSHGNVAYFPIFSRGCELA